MADEPRAKVAFTADDGQVETLWAFHVGPDRYKLDNSPWYQYGISCGDIVEATSGPDGYPTFRRVVEKSGYRTVRVIFDQPLEKGDPFFVAIQELGCGFEGAYGRLIAIDVPPSVSLEAVTGFLVKKGVQWEYADPTYEQVHGG
jgi:hypothetical protein